MVPSDSALSSYIYIYNENKNGYTDAELARMINYSMSPFELVQEYSYFVTTNKAVTNKYLVILAIMFSLFAVFLIIRYRFFGFLSLLSLLFFIFILLTAIIALGIKITPIVAIAIIVSVIVAFDLIHNTLDSMKKAINEGSNASKAIAKARKTTLIPSLDVIFVLLVYSIFNIYINLSQNYAISLILFASSIISLAISIILNTLILRS
ncbi:bifunctional preprotein translocase subunit SecD/SecF [Chlamydia abortus]|jgi:protein-export membrane protein secD|nr:bifunctional preprotein translocase subunit SecD/SecF [Chlamydia abortus]